MGVFNRSAQMGEHGEHVAPRQIVQGGMSEYFLKSAQMRTIKRGRRGDDFHNDKVMGNAERITCCKSTITDLAKHVNGSPAATSLSIMPSGWRIFRQDRTDLLSKNRAADDNVGPGHNLIVTERPIVIIAQELELSRGFLRMAAPDPAVFAGANHRHAQIPVQAAAFAT